MEVLCTKYRHFPNYSVPLLIAKNKEIKGHFNDPPPPLPSCDVLKEYDSTEIRIFRDTHVQPGHVAVQWHYWGHSYIALHYIGLVRNYKVRGLGAFGWGILFGGGFKYHNAQTKFRE
jgi:hypothetical protein